MLRRSSRRLCLAARQIDGPTSSACHTRVQSRPIQEPIRHKHDLHNSGPQSTFMLLYEYVEDMAIRRDSYRAAHLSHTQRHKERGSLLMGGAFADEMGAAYVFRAKDREEVEEFVRSDPHNEHGLVTHYSIKEWHLIV